MAVPLLGDLPSQIGLQRGPFCTVDRGPIEHLLVVPNGLFVPLLKLDPFWDPLGKDPRFQKLCQESPKTGDK
jgi:hypothetical protein